MKAHPDDILRTVLPTERAAVVRWYASRPEVHPYWHTLAGGV